MQHGSLKIRTFVGGFVNERDKAELELSDVLDIKASIVLVIITFLGTLVERLNLSGAATVFGVITVLSLAGSCALVVLALWPREYQFESTPSDIRSSVEKICKSFIDHPEDGKTPEESALEYASEKHLAATEMRLGSNYALNRMKAKRTCWSFYALLPAIIIEMSVLLVRASNTALAIKIPF
jgi:hypothetical protein